MTNPTLIITKLLTAAAMLGLLGESETGVGAYYQPGLMEDVCRRRVERGWTPDLHCDWPCLVAGIEQDTLGDWVLVDLPGASYHFCQVVDVGAEEDLPALRERGEVIEISWGLAQKAGWDGYQEGVSVWNLGRGGPPG